MTDTAAAHGDEYDAIIAEAERPDPDARPPRPRSMVAVSVFFLIAGLLALFLALVMASVGGERIPGEIREHGPTLVSVEHAPGPLSPAETAAVTIGLIQGVLFLAAALLLLDKAAGWWLGLGHGVLGVALGVGGALAWVLQGAGRDLPWWADNMARGWVVTVAVYWLILYFLTRPRAMRYYGIGRFAQAA